MQLANCRCLICHTIDPGRDAGLVETVREHGWCALRIVGGGPEFAYTVGLWHTFRRPELVMFGLDGENMQAWLNTCVRLHSDKGWPEDGQQFEGVIDAFPTLLRTVDESWRDALFGSAYRFYRGWPVPVRQLVWPDRDGLWPWQEGATVSSRTRQAFAWLPVTEHPEGGWRLVGEMGADFPFRYGPDSRALTTQRVLDGHLPVARVGFEGGSFDVLDERGYDADDLCVTFLGELVKRHPGLGAFADLAEGQFALADGTTIPMSAREREASTLAWERYT